MRVLLIKAAAVVCLGALPAGDSPGAVSKAIPDRIAEGEAGPATRPTDGPPLDRAHSFYFTRAAYSGVRGSSTTPSGVGWSTTDPRGAWAAGNACGGGFCAWATDYPKAELQFVTVLRRLTNLDAAPVQHAVRLDDPELRRFPFIYAVEVGYMDLTEAEVQGLRAYLEAGGFLVVDDFWGTREWRAFEAQMRRVLPEYPIVEIPLDHPLFSAFYDIEEIVQVPNVAQGVAGGPTHERDGYEPRVRGIFDAEGRLLVVMNWNTDFGDAWEWAEQPLYPLRYSTHAYRMGINLVVYAMSH